MFDMQVRIGILTGEHMKQFFRGSKISGGFSLHLFLRSRY